MAEIDLHVPFTFPFGKSFIAYQTSIQRAIFFLKIEVELPYVEHWNPLRFENITNRQKDVFGNEVFRDVKED